ncbi:Transcriptional regulator, AraC family [Candidatus Filomicrobium marinum]|uniref:Transcriptional regulator, AraC family n=2 Tax=Filomicrobium TaxID=119044 RepID=A0A0D6JG75_9HYPH|nr:MULTISPECIES: helix-turn-helix transcriptional regulator [Filomicrobium]MCV0370100.1 helix-turn-helix transcriptional regulator [Filomicrobium sp.]CFX26341.1 Transcriptional regulator, AraC family [Candidatus Filomicrobium marinum]CPR19424.1 Transcriptional regulator, AraC family [Candidatus Filomicrobium marinum]SDO07209.1 AraC-type DNA-binding protein [Filomicrobium insigne]
MMQRSTDAADYQELPVAVAVMRKHFPADWVTPFHSHRRDQLLLASSGTMRVRTQTHSWIVPPQRAVYMPGGFEHTVAMRDPVEMRTLYIEPKAHRDLPSACVVISPSALLKELINALLDEPVDYSDSSRGLCLSQLILEEVCRGRSLDLSIPMPSDPRLMRVCEHVLGNPGDHGSLGSYADLAGASERTLARLSQDELGMGFAAWRQHIRFHYALEDLARGTPVGKVAHACGYASVSAFTAAFRKSLGHPPTRILEHLSEVSGLEGA